MKPAIEITGLGKKYQTSAFALPFFGNLVRGKATSREEFWALQGIDLRVQRGEVVGILGRNGSGKSTLLRIVSRITTPSIGEAVVRGRLSSLLEIGTGFHPELSGRENIYLNGAILGMSKKFVDEKMPEILAFAEIGRFLDQPVKRYSSGMYLRLAFSVASHLEPDILLLDEVLAVGDGNFRQKCLERVYSLSRSGITVLIVSHQLEHVKALCHRAIYLHEGRKVLDGDVDSVIRHYEKENA